MRKLTRIFALVLASLALLATAYLATASAAPATTGPDHQPLQVYGQGSWPLQEAIGYWNEAAGREVLHYAGSTLSATAANDRHTVVVQLDELTGGSGETVGRPGQTAQLITVDSRAMFRWDAYARQLGEALDRYDHHRL